jgi:hypothetical protein
MSGRIKVLLIITGARSQYVLLRDGSDPVVSRTGEDYRGHVNIPQSIAGDEDLKMFVR